MNLEDLNPEHRSIAEKARERVTRLINGQALKSLVENIDTKLANACNSDTEDAE